MFWIKELGKGPVYRGYINTYIMSSKRGTYGKIGLYLKYGSFRWGPKEVFSGFYFLSGRVGYKASFPFLSLSLDINEFLGLPSLPYFCQLPEKKWLSAIFFRA